MQIMINNIAWKIKFIPGSSGELKDYDGKSHLGMTDNNVKIIYINKQLENGMLYSVLCHELVHAFCFSYGIYFDIEDEERLASFIEHFGNDILHATNTVYSYVE